SCDIAAKEPTWRTASVRVERMSQSPMTNEVERKVFKFVLAGAGSDQQAARFQNLANTNALRAMKIKDIDGFETISLSLLNKETRDFTKIMPQTSTPSDARSPRHTETQENQPPT